MDLHHKFIRLAGYSCRCSVRKLQVDLSSLLDSLPKVNGHPSFMAIANGSFGLIVLRHS